MLKLLIIIIILFCVLAGTGWYLAGYTMGIIRQSLEHARAWQEDHYDLSFYDSLEKEDYTVESYDGYILHAQHLKNPEGRGRWVIISHGYTDNRFGALKYAKMYLDDGFDVIVYDLRGHGLNEPTFCTYSARERKDLLAIIADARERFGPLGVLGIHGESLGAATSIACLESKPELDFVVADCGFSNIADVLKQGASAMHVPGAAIDLASAAAKLRYGYSYKDMRPIDCLKDNHVPIMFIHGAADNFILPQHSRDMQAATAGYSELHLIEGAPHAMSVLTDPEAYRGHLYAFLKSIGIDE